MIILKSDTLLSSVVFLASKVVTNERLNIFMNTEKKRRGQERRRRKKKYRRMLKFMLNIFRSAFSYITKYL